MSRATGDEGRRLRVDLDIEPGREWDCPIVSEADSVADVNVNAVGDECNVDLQPADGGDMIRATGEVGDDCLCYVFQRFGCVPHIQRVRDGTMLVTTYVDDRAVVRGLIEGLQGILGHVRLVRLAVVEGPDASEQVTFDLSSLTTKQRQGLELAVVRGYFDDDRDVDLGQLADELDISKSALSQRLRTAQAKLIKEVFDESGA
ncbi:helix-turn-helix domain-containing protein [Halorubrum sp. JWXQ-INN 858]|uniref:helix-turn-helix domain-containing protein n=1 Tax=Halorubrum sp. JWXQ-INN 858 TaxID=2690782 RepID=UPI00135BAA22|nr:helix-turn-helix domain-containing protein [Halorubrum sp. JWXQ-INN 858]MWV64008.1 helix-turn-helix domain-containing protein [Halorubrum sp. JWXQ-INN 858]